LLKFTQIKGELPEHFRRLMGIKRSTFDVMVAILQEAEQQRKTWGGKPNTMSPEDRLIKSGLFSLPGKKARLKSDVEYNENIIYLCKVQVSLVSWVRIVISVPISLDCLLNKRY
jgi:hypothetical protein